MTDYVAFTEKIADEIKVFKERQSAGMEREEAQYVYSQDDHLV